MQAKFRYRQNDQEVTLERLDESTVKATFPQGIRSVTPGQEAVFYHEDAVIGGGEIDQVFQQDTDLSVLIQETVDKGTANGR